MQLYGRGVRAAVERLVPQEGARCLRIAATAVSPPELLRTVRQCKHVGGIVSATGHLGLELHHRVTTQSTALRELRKAVLCKSKVPEAARRWVINAYCDSRLLHGTCTWDLLTP